MFRRHFIAVGAGALAMLAGAARAQGFPTRPVRLVVPFPAGGSTDALLRLLAEDLRATWQQPVLIENKPGGGTIIGTDVVARSAPDGHTVGVIVPAFTANPSLHAKLPYDTFKDLSGVTMLAKMPVCLYASNDFPARNLQEFLAYARRNKGMLSYGTVGAGSQAHIAAEAFSMATGTDLRHVPYKGSAPAQADLMGGHLQLLLDALPSGIELVKAGKFKLLAVGSPERSPLAPDVSSFSEVLPGFVTEAFFGLVVPSATPRATVDRIHAGVVQALGRPEVREWMQTRGYTTTTMQPRDFDAYLLAEYRHSNDVIVKRNIRIN